MKKIIVSIIIIGVLLNTIPISIGELGKHPILNSSTILEDTQKIGLFVKNQVMQLDGEDEIMLTFSFNPPILTEFIQNGKTYTKVMIEGLPISNDIGVPLLPVKPVNILLPQQTKVESITITKGEAIVLGGRYNLELGTEPVTINTAHENELCEDIKFNPLLTYPIADFENVGTYNFRGYSILTFVLYPVRYIGQNKEIYYYDDMTVTIKTTETFSVNPLFRNSPVDEMMIREMVNDYSRSSTYMFFDPQVFRNSLTTSGDSYEYVVITSEELKNSTGEYTFQDLIQYKNDNGISATIVTLEDIYATYEGVDTPEKIRNFITDAYLNCVTEYVLLGGDIDVVPARILYVEAYEGETTNMPADLYYGCLDGTYNYDGDEYWGEPHDGENGGDVDLRAEVYVGRACVGNESEVSNFVMKTLAYEQAPIDESYTYLRKALMVGENLGWAWGGDYKDEIINGSNNYGYSTVGVPDSKYNVSKLYDRDWGNMYDDWPKLEIINRLNAGFNIINHLGHSGYDYNMKMNNSDVDALINDKYCFIYSQGCMAGGFDNGDCIAEHFTLKTNHGAFAGIWNARYGWGTRGSTDGPSQRFDREFFDAIFNEGVRYPKKTSLGAANQDSKEDNLWRINQSCMRWCYYELNLFGDPQISLKPVPKYEHDLAVDSIEFSKPVNPDEPFEISTRIVNQGLSNETNVLGNISIMEILDTVNIEETQVYEYNWIIDSLTSGDDAVIKLTCTLPRGFYRIRSNVYIIPGEEVIFNNNMNVVIFIGDNTPPNTPNRPSGPRWVIHGKSYKFSTSTTDPEEDRVYYQWSWGYDQFSQPLYSGWLGPYESGETITTYNTWHKYDLGMYRVGVIAKDVYGAMSGWSEYLSSSINVPVNQQSSNQQLQSSSNSQQLINYFNFYQVKQQVYN